MLGLKIKDNDQDFTLVAVIDPSRLIKKMGASFREVGKEFSAAMAFELRTKLIPIHARLFPLKKVTSIVESSLVQIKKAGQEGELIRLTLTPSANRMAVLCESLSKGGEVFAKVTFSRSVSILDIEDDSLEVSLIPHGSRIGAMPDELNQTEYRFKRNEIRIRMEALEETRVTLYRRFKVSLPTLDHALNKPFFDGTKPPPMFEKIYDYLLEKEKESILV